MLISSEMVEIVGEKKPHLEPPLIIRRGHQARATGQVTPRREQATNQITTQTW